MHINMGEGTELTAHCWVYEEQVTGAGAFELASDIEQRQSRRRVIFDFKSKFDIL